MDWLPRRMACFGLGVAAFGGGCTLIPWSLGVGLPLVALGVVLLGTSFLNWLWIGGLEIRVSRKDSSADWCSDYVGWISGLVGECPETAELCTRLSCSLSCIKITNHGHYDTEIQRIWLAFMRWDRQREIEPLSIQKEIFKETLGATRLRERGSQVYELDFDAVFSGSVRHRRPRLCVKVVGVGIRRVAVPRELLPGNKNKKRGASFPAEAGKHATLEKAAAETPPAPVPPSAVPPPPASATTDKDVAADTEHLRVRAVMKDLMPGQWGILARLAHEGPTSLLFDLDTALLSNARLIQSIGPGLGLLSAGTGIELVWRIHPEARDVVIEAIAHERHLHP